MVDVLMIEQVVYTIIITLCCVGFHEFGHGYYITEKLKRKIKLAWFKKELAVAIMWDDTGCTNKQRSDVVFYGIMGGFIPFIMFGNMVYTPFLLILICGYLFACKNDIRELFRLRKDETKGYTDKV
jgi:hypothetical protein